MRVRNHQTVNFPPDLAVAVLRQAVEDVENGLHKVEYKKKNKNRPIPPDKFLMSDGAIWCASLLGIEPDLYLSYARRVIQ